MKEKRNEIIPVQYIAVQQCNENDEIDLKELIKTILKYKKFILIFTTIVTLLAVVYVNIKKPIYEISTNIETGYINTYTQDGVVKKYFMQPNTLKIYIESVFDQKDNPIKSYPRVTTSIVKGTKDILNIKIDAYSNKEALNYLNKIINDIHSKENKQINAYKNLLVQEIKVLQDSKKQLILNKQNYLHKIKTLNNAQTISTLLQAISDIENQLLTINEKIVNLKAKVSSVNIKNTQIIGKIKKKDSPIKPKKKLIVIVAFITSFILSIFLVFFIEFIKSFKEEDLQTK